MTAYGRFEMAEAKAQTAPRTALITGGARRIGRAIAPALAPAGYAVVLHALRSRAEAENLADEIAAAGGRATVVLADLANADRPRISRRRCFISRRPKASPASPSRSMAASIRAGAPPTPTARG